MDRIFNKFKLLHNILASLIITKHTYCSSLSRKKHNSNKSLKSFLYYNIWAHYRCTVCKLLTRTVFQSVTCMCVRVRSSAVHTVWYSLLIRQAAKPISHLCMCSHSAYRESGSAQLQRWKYPSVQENGEKNGSARTTHHPQGAKSSASLLQFTTSYFSCTVLLNTVSLFRSLFTPPGCVTEGSKHAFGQREEGK